VNIGVRAGGGGLEGCSPPPTFGQFDFLGNDENLGGRPGKGFLEKIIFFRQKNIFGAVTCVLPKNK